MNNEEFYKKLWDDLRKDLRELDKKYPVQAAHFYKTWKLK